MQLINATPHAVVLHLADGQVLELPPSGMVARAVEQRSHIDDLVVDVDGQWSAFTVRINHVTMSPFLVGIPDQAYGIGYVVSRAAAEAARDRADLFVPDDTVRDPNTGRIIGCRALARV